MVLFPLYSPAPFASAALTLPQFLLFYSNIAKTLVVVMQIQQPHLFASV